MRAARVYAYCLQLILVLWGRYAFPQTDLSNQFIITDRTFKSKFDETEQKYVELLPNNFRSDQTYDMIIGLHGHGSDRWQFATQERPECLAFRTFAAKHNMIAITPDYRAKTSWMGPAAEADVLQIIEELRTTYKIGKVYLIGGSMGGTSALTFAAIHPHMINGVTSMNGHANHLEYENFQSHIAASFGGTKDAFPDEYKKRSAEYWPEILTMPIAFTVGELDKSVPPHSVIRLYEILKKLNRKVFLINHTGGGHSTSFHEAMSALEFMINP